MSTTLTDVKEYFQFSQSIYVLENSRGISVHAFEFS